MKHLFKYIGDKLLKHDGTLTDTSSLLSEDIIIGLLFSARWCPSCKGFTDKLVEFQKVWNIKSDDPDTQFTDTKNNKKLEIIFVSSDRNEEDFKECFKQIKWYAIPYVDRGKKVSNKLPLRLYLIKAYGKFWEQAYSTSFPRS